jgi:hypothetical protein
VAINPSKVVKTEFSTFTYLITSLNGDAASVSTDIVVSTNIITESAPQVLATPVLPDIVASNFVSFCPVFVFAPRGEGVKLLAPPFF